MSLRNVGMHVAQNSWQPISLNNFVLLIIALTLQSCSSSPTKPPVGMPPLAAVEKTSSGECPPIAGSYSDTGNAIGEDGANLGSVSLIDLLFSTRPQIEMKGSGSTPPPMETSDTVVLSGPDQGVIQFESFKGLKSTAVLRQAKRGLFSHSFGFACINGFLLLPSESGGGLPGLMVYSSDPLLFRKGVDDSLIVQRPNVHGAMIMIVPVWSTKTTWYHFPAVTEQGESAPDQLPRERDNNPSGTELGH